MKDVRNNPPKGSMASLANAVKEFNESSNNAAKNKGNNNKGKGNNIKK